MPKTKQIAISDIIISPELQARPEIDSSHVKDIAEVYGVRGRPKIKAPRVIEVQDGPKPGIYAVDQHRIEGAIKAHRQKIDVQYIVGNWQDARDLASSANVEHLGLKRNHDAKINAILMCLEDHPTWSDGRIAKHTGTAPTTVASHRPKVGKAAAVKPADRVGIDNSKGRAGKPSKNGKHEAVAPADPDDPDRFEELLNSLLKVSTEFNRAINSEGGEKLMQYLTYFKLIVYPNRTQIDGESVDYRPVFKGFPGIRRLIKYAALPGRARTEAQVRAEFARKEEDE